MAKAIPVDFDPFAEEVAPKQPKPMKASSAAKARAIPVDFDPFDDNEYATRSNAPKDGGARAGTVTNYEDNPFVQARELRESAKSTASVFMSTKSTASVFMNRDRLLDKQQKRDSTRAAKRKADEAEVPADKAAGEEFMRASEKRAKEIKDQEALFRKESDELEARGRFMKGPFALNRARRELLASQEKRRLKPINTPEAYAAEKTGTDRGIMGDVGDAVSVFRPVMQETVGEPARRVLTPSVAPRDMTARAGKAVRRAEETMNFEKQAKVLRARKDYDQLLSKAKADLKAGMQLTPDQEIILASDKSFAAEAKRVAEGLKDDEFLGELVVGFIEDLPLMLVTGGAIGAGINSVRKASQIYRAAAKAEAIKKTATSMARAGKLAERGDEAAAAAVRAGQATAAGAAPTAADAAGAASFAKTQGQVADRAIQLERTRKAVKDAKRALGRRTFTERMGEEMVQNIGALMAIDYPTLKAQGQEWGWGPLIQNVGLGTAFSAVTAGAGAAMDKGVSRKTLDKAGEVAHLAGIEQHPRAKEMIPLFAAMADNPEFMGDGGKYTGPRFRVSPEKKTITAEEGAKAYGIPVEEFRKTYGDEVIVGGATGTKKVSKAKAQAGVPQKGEVRVWGDGDNATVVEELTHHLQERLREKAVDEGGTGPWSDLLEKMDAWHESVVAEARVRSEAGDKVKLPDGDELFGQALAAHMGYAKNLPKDIRRVVIPDDILEGFKDLIGDDKTLSGDSFEKGDISGLKNLDQPGVNRGEPGDEPPLKEDVSPGFREKQEEPKLTPEAVEFMRGVEQYGAIPAFMTKNLKEIAEANGVKVTRNTTPDDVIEAFQEIRSKRPAYDRRAEMDDATSYVSAGDALVEALTARPASEGGRATLGRVLYVHPDDLKRLGLQGTEASGGRKASSSEAWKSLGIPVKVTRGAKRLAAIAEEFAETLREERNAGRPVTVWDVDDIDLEAVNPDDMVTAFMNRSRGKEQRARDFQDFKARQKFGGKGRDEESALLEHERELKLDAADALLRERFSEDEIGRMTEQEKLDWYDEHAEAESNAAFEAARNAPDEGDDSPLPFNLKPDVPPDWKEISAKLRELDEYVKGLKYVGNHSKADVELWRKNLARKVENLKKAQEDLNKYSKEFGHLEETSDIAARVLNLLRRNVAIWEQETQRGWDLFNDVRREPHSSAKGIFFNLKPLENDRAPIFYSALRRTVEQKMPNSMTPDALRGMLKGAVKEEELAWMDLDSFLAGKEKVSKADLLRYLDENAVDVQEVVKGGRDKNISIDEAKEILERGGQVYAVSRTDENEISGATLDDGKTILPYIIANQERFFLREGSPEAAIKREIGTRFDRYQLPGGENYRELLLTMPSRAKRLDWQERRNAASLRALFFKPYDELSPSEKSRFDDIYGGESAWKRRGGTSERIPDDFRSSHFEEPNILAHVRFNDRTTADGRRVLFLEEIQSDWHQEGRKKGYGDSRPWVVYSMDDNSVLSRHATRQEADAAKAARAAPRLDTRMESRTDKVPDGPFKKTWHELALRRMLRYAAENGYDELAWLPGKEQAARYDLSKSVGRIQTVVEGDTRFVDLDLHAGEDVSMKVDADGIIKGGEFSGKPLSDVVGKEVAEKIMAVPDGETGVLSGTGLQIGGEGMTGFYDRIVPQYLNKYGKKWGARVGEIKVFGSDRPGASGYEIRRPNGESYAGPFDTEAEARPYLENPSDVIVRVGDVTVPSIPITDAMRASVLGDGQPLFNLKQREDALDLVGVPKKDRRLMEIHNLSEEGVLAAERLGGIPAPSVAVTGEDIPFTGFGSISLIGNRKLIDPEAHYGNKVFAADAYSTRQPMPIRNVDRKKMRALIQSLPEKAFKDAGASRWDIEEILSKPAREGNFRNALLDIGFNRGMKNAFLTERGEGVVAETIPAQLHYNALFETEAQRQKAVEAFPKDLDPNKPEDRKKATEIWEKLLPAKMRKYKDAYLDEDGELRYSALSHLLRDIEKIRSKATERDFASARKKIDDRIRELETEYDEWVREKVEPVFGEEYLKRGGRKERYTIDNIVEAMRGAGVRAKEKGMSYSVGKARASAVKAFKNVDEMKKASGRLVDEEKMKAAKDAFDKKFFELADKVVSEYSSTFQKLDDFSKAIGDYLKGRRTSEGMRASLRKNGLTASDESVVADAMKLAADLEAMPTEYFEAKPLRPVALSEFTGALVPEGTDPNVIESLRRQGVTRIVEYSNKRGPGGEGRLEARKQFEDALFNLKPAEEAGVPKGKETDEKWLARARKAWEEKGTDSPFFRRWFGDSKVVDAEGKPLVVYHGTPKSGFEEFQDIGGGVYFTDNPKLANQYTDARVGFRSKGESPSVIPAFISLKNPLEIDADGAQFNNIPVPWQDFKPSRFGVIPQDAVSIGKAYARALEMGHDGLIVKNVFDRPFPGDRGMKSTVYVASRPTQIKSATGNRGTFDAESPNILHNLKPSEEAGIPAGKEESVVWLDRAARAWREKGTDSPWFKRWFGKSKVVDDAGKPLVVYHGTSGNFDNFDMKKGGSVWGTSDSKDVAWFTSYEGRANAAARDAAQVNATSKSDWKNETGSNVMPVYLRLENPKVFTEDEIIGPVSKLAEKIEKARADGHDGIIMPGEMGGEDFAVFSPDQVKSAIGNRGTFGGESANVRYNLKPGEVRAQPSDVKTPEGNRNKFLIMVDALAKRASSVSDVVLRGVGKEEAKAIKAATKVDLTGARHRVPRHALQHFLNSHEREVKGGKQVPITPRDMMRIPEIIDNPDAYKRGSDNVDGPSVIFIKQFPDGRIHYVEVVKKEKGGVVVAEAKTMWKEAPPPSPAKGELGNTATRPFPREAEPGRPYEGGNPSAKDVGATGKPAAEPSPPPGQNVPPPGESGTGKFNLKPDEEAVSEDVETGGKTPRVEQRVAALRETEAATGDFSVLERENPREWKMLEPEVQEILLKWKDEDFYDAMKKRALTDAEKMAWDARVAFLAEQKDKAYAAMRSAKDPKARAEASRQYTLSALSYAASLRAQVNDGTATARALAAMRRVMSAKGPVDNVFLKKVFKELGDKVTDEQASELLRIYLQDPEAFPHALQQVLGGWNVRSLVELWKAGLLTAFGTHIANLTGNTLEPMMRAAESVVAGGLDRLAGGSRVRFSRDGAAEMVGLAKAAPTAFRNLGTNLRSVHKPRAVNLETKFDHQLNATPGKLGVYPRTVFGMLSVADDFFKDLGFNEAGGGAALFKVAYRQARKELGPKANSAQVSAKMEDVLKRIMKGDEEYLSLARDIRQERLSRTYQEDPGEFVRMLIRLGQKYPIVDFILPFKKTPANLLRLTVQRSPLGAVSFGKKLMAWEKAKRAGADAAVIEKLRGEAMDAGARFMLGTAMFAAFYGMAASGMMTGRGPSDPKERKNLEETGWRPHALRFVVGKDVYYLPFVRFEPISTIMAVAADLAEEGGADQDLITKAISSLGENVTNKAYLQGLQDFGRVLNPEDRFFATYLSGLGASVVPNIVGKAAQAIDPVMRNTKSSSSGVAGIPELTANKIRSRIPGVSKGLPARTSSTGEEVMRPGGPLSRFFLPAIPSKERGDREVERILAEIGYTPTPVERQFNLSPSLRKQRPDLGKKVELTDKEHAVLVGARKTATKYLKGLVDSGTWEGYDEEQRARAAELVYERFMNAARRKVIYGDEKAGIQGILKRPKK